MGKETMMTTIVHELTHLKHFKLGLNRTTAYGKGQTEGAAYNSAKNYALSKGWYCEASSISDFLYMNARFNPPEIEYPLLFK